MLLEVEKMIILLNGGYYFEKDCDNINKSLISYVEYIGLPDKRVFEILANSNAMSTDELIKYINDNVYSYEDKIVEVYEVGKKIY